jgi:signal transduction protein with GAF and PtsI domain
MSHAETSPAISEESKIKTSIRNLVVGGLALITLVASAMTVWNHQEARIDKLADTTEDHGRQITTVQVTVGGLRDEFRTMQAKQDAQLEILRYLAKDRRGPVPDAAK